MEYKIPLEKGRPTKVTDYAYYIPPGSPADSTVMVQPVSPTMPFKFPFKWGFETQGDAWDLGDINAYKPLMHESVKRVVGLMRMCGLTPESDVCVWLTCDPGNTPKLMDGGTIVCITGVLDLLVDVESIAPLPISVAMVGGSVSNDDCCTKQGLLPLTLDDSSIYYQPCFYCKNAVETIVSPQSILTVSDVLVRWTQTGHKDGTPGKIWFESDSGLLSFLITLENRDGLYYCPTDVFTVESDPSHCTPYKICREIVEPPPVRWCQKSYMPVSLDRLTESELWMLRLGTPGEDQLDLLPSNVTGIPPTFEYHPFRYIDWKEEARVQRNKAHKLAERTVGT